MSCNQATECTFVVAFRVLDCSEELATFGCTSKAATLDHIVQELSSSELGLQNGECKCSRAQINHYFSVDLTHLSSYTLTTTLQTTITIPRSPYHKLEKSSSIAHRHGLQRHSTRWTTNQARRERRHVEARTAACPARYVQRAELEIRLTYLQDLEHDWLRGTLERCGWSEASALIVSKEILYHWEKQQR
jgi:hypothetical protein